MIWTKEHAANLEQYLETHTLPVGLGSKERACSIAVINLAISGELTDTIPDCMSKVLGKAIIPLQDGIPNDMRNSARYRAMLQRAPGTGRDKEEERLEVLMDWMWGTVLPKLQPYADDNGFGDEWHKVCDERTETAAEAAEAAIYTADARFVEVAATYAAAAARFAADAAVYTADADRVYFIKRNDFWQEVDTIGVLERMIAVGDNFNISSVTDRESTDVT